MAGVYMAASAVVTGEVFLEDNVSVWHNSTLRGDTASIRIGKESNIQDNVCIHAGDGYPVFLGEQVSVGHGAILHGCRIEDGTVVGMGTIVLNGAHIEKDCLIGAGTLVTQGMHIPAGSLVLGSPAKIHRRLEEEEIRHNRENALHYVKMAKEQL